MQINQKGLELLKSFEQCRLVVYDDGFGYNTVGWGHRTSLPIGSRITAAEAEDALRADLACYEQCVNHSLHCKVSDNKFSAMVCFCFNVGEAAFEGSTLLKLVNLGAFEEAAEQFLRWNKVKGRVVPGLTKRRQAERALFLTPSSLGVP